MFQIYERRLVASQIVFKRLRVLLYNYLEALFNEKEINLHSVSVSIKLKT